MTHPAALAHPAPETVLVIGGGDGGSSEELFKHPSIKRIVMAELDPAVIEVARTYLGAINRGALDDPRLEIRLGDGYEYVRTTTERFDMIVLDLTDPDTPAFKLYSEEFFRMCQRCLKPGGMLTLHLGSPVYQATRCARTLRTCAGCSHGAAVAFIPLYGSQVPGVASDTIDPRNIVETSRSAFRTPARRLRFITRRCIRRCSRCRALRRS
jgi:spermidine synthase